MTWHMILRHRDEPESLVDLGPLFQPDGNLRPAVPLECPVCSHHLVWTDEADAVKGLRICRRCELQFMLDFVSVTGPSWPNG